MLSGNGPDQIQEDRDQRDPYKNCHAEWCSGLNKRSAKYVRLCPAFGQDRIHGKGLPHGRSPEKDPAETCQKKSQGDADQTYRTVPGTGT